MLFFICFHEYVDLFIEKECIFKYNTNLKFTDDNIKICNFFIDFNFYSTKQRITNLFFLKKLKKLKIIIVF